MTTAYGKGIDPKLVVVVAGIVVAIILALAISSMGQSAELPSSMKVEVPNPIEKIIPQTDPIEARLQEVATEEIHHLNNLAIYSGKVYLYTVDDFCNEIIVVREEKDPLIGNAMVLGTAHGYYAGPILFLDDKGNEVDFIRAVALHPEGGLIMSAEHKDCKMIGTKTLNPTFKERYGKLFEKR
ncbi:MAG: hypothetical protein ACOX0B_00515 [Minisyncoccales bacterium]|jgi:hypothetical protein